MVGNETKRKGILEMATRTELLLFLNVYNKILFTVRFMFIRILLPAYYTI